MYEAVCLVLANALRAARREEGICHIFHTIDPGGKSSRIEVENVSEKRFFFF
jgi:hypothetical protein